MLVVSRAGAEWRESGAQSCSVQCPVRAEIHDIPLTMTPIALLPGLLLAVAAQSDYDYVSECPDENGFFADALQCDRYYECSDGEVRVSNIYYLGLSLDPVSVKVSEHFCPDGLVFDESSTAFAKCGFPFAVDCTGSS